MIALAQWLEQPLAQCVQAVSSLGAGAARGDTFQIQGRNQLLDDGGLHGERQIKGLDLGLQGGEEKGERGEQLGRSAASARCPSCVQTCVKRCAMRSTGCACPVCTSHGY